TSTAGPAGGLGGARDAPTCGIGSSFLVSLAPRAGGARGERRESNLNQTLGEVPTGFEPNTANFGATIPVYIHVIRVGQAVEQGNAPTRGSRTRSKRST